LQKKALNAKKKRTKKPTPERAGLLIEVLLCAVLVVRARLQAGVEYELVLCRRQGQVVGE
jgi:hypothetical protein